MSNVAVPEDVSPANMAIFEMLEYIVNQVR